MNYIKYVGVKNFNEAKCLRQKGSHILTAPAEFNNSLINRDFAFLCLFYINDITAERIAARSG